MKIVFCLNTVGLTGGVKIVFTHANNLIKKGHKVIIVYPLSLNPNWFSKEGFLALLKIIKGVGLKILNRPPYGWFPLKTKVIRVPFLSAKWLPDADIVIATANETADWVAKLPSQKGKKFYFIQGYETWTRDKKLVDRTWKLPLKKIVISSWLKKMGEEKFKEKIYGPVPNGLDFSQFYNYSKKYSWPPRILLSYSPIKFKGFKDGLTAFKIVKQKYPKIKLVIFSAYQRNSEIPSEAEFHYQPQPAQLRKIYSSCDIFVLPSHSEGFSLTAMEAMACQTAVVATDCGGVTDFAINNKTALVVPIKKPKLLAEAIIELIESPTKLKQISQNGLSFVKKFTWSKSTNKLEKILLEN